MSDNESIDIKKLEKKIGYKFMDKSLLYEALTHPSMRKSGKNYERLEFLGNAILGAILADMIFHIFPNMHEGSLSVIQSKLASTDGIVQAAANLQIENYMIVNYSEEKSGGRSNPHNVENCVEAIIGAMYIDGGYTAASQFVKTFWSDRIANTNDLNVRDAKSRLQEFCQKNGIPIPVYKVVATDGFVHAPIFTISCDITLGKKKFSGQAEANTKKLAEMKCAEQILESLEEQNIK